MRALLISVIIGLVLLQCSAKTPEVTLHTSDGQIQIQVEIAASSSERRRGLMGRKQLGNREGMLFVFPALSLSPFWMENTPVSLDIVFIGEDLQIAEIAAKTIPYSRELIRPAHPYRYVLEIKGGTATDIGLHAGDRISIPPSLAH